MNDPIGQAIYDYYVNGKAENIIIQTNYTEDEHLDPSCFFRREEEMPPLEKTALSLCRGEVLDVGAGAGSHSLILQEKGIHVSALELSALAAEVIRKRGVQNVTCSDIYKYRHKKFDTILSLMNGTGIGGTISGFKKLLLHLKSLLNENGSILIDSSDIKYLFEEDDGSVWIDLSNTNYYGEMTYWITYKTLQSKFNWLFVDFDTLHKIAASSGLNCTMIERGNHYDYLAQLTS